MFEKIRVCPSQFEFGGSQACAGISLLSCYRMLMTEDHRTINWLTICKDGALSWSVASKDISEHDVLSTESFLKERQIGEWLERKEEWCGSVFWNNDEEINSNFKWSQQQEMDIRKEFSLRSLSSAFSEVFQSKESISGIISTNFHVTSFGYFPLSKKIYYFDSYGEKNIGDARSFAYLYIFSEYSHFIQFIEDRLRSSQVEGAFSIAGQNEIIPNQFSMQVYKLKKRTSKYLKRKEISEPIAKDSNIQTTIEKETNKQNVNRTWNNDFDPVFNSFTEATPERSIHHFGDFYAMKTGYQNNPIQEPLEMDISKPKMSFDPIDY